jgi:Spy/CpxP family protein refolding chaperone
MKTLWTVLALMAIGVYVRAEEPGVRGRLAEKFEELNLTDDQEVKIAEIRKEFRPKVEEAIKELVAVSKEEVEKVRGVLTPAQTAKLDELKDDRRDRRAEGLAERSARLDDLDLTEGEMTKVMEIRKEFHPRIVKALEGLTGILSAEQRTARDEALKAGKKHREVIATLNLTPEQKEKVEAACKEVGTIVREEMEKIREVLTTAQEEKLQEIKDERPGRARDRIAQRISTLKELELTDEQKAKIVEIRTEYRPKVHEAGNKLRAVVRAELDQIIAAIKA